MANQKISALPAATTPLGGTEILPLVQGGVTVKVTTDDLTVKNFRSNTTSGILQVAGPAVGTTRTMTTPNANFTVARTDATQTFTGDQNFNNDINMLVGNLVVGTANKGIDFSANTHAAGMTSELLNDYEEGTWTPNQGAGLTVIGAFSSFGAYTKIGRLVTVNFYLTGATSIAAAQGNFMLTNLPFTVSAFNAIGSATNSAPSASSDLLALSNSVIPATAIAATAQIFGTITYSV